MKRFVLPFLLILPLLAGCSKNEMESPFENPDLDPQEKIAVNVAVESIVETRGTPASQATQIEDFGFFCSYTANYQWTVNNVPNRMHNKKMIRDANGFWIYADGMDVTWDSNTAADMYTFFAYAPYAAATNGITVTTTAVTPGVPRLSYTVPATAGQQPDLMIAVPKRDIHPTGHPVALQMKHALTAIGFTVQGQGTIKGLSISGVYVAGSLPLDGGTVNWTISGALLLSDFPAGLAGATFTANPAVELNPLASDGYLMMIPQQLTGAAKVKITFSDSSTMEVALNQAVSQWNAGEKIIYRIKF